ncbi:uncharacterized protein PV07_12812 [Cladophialophora immunda]|uniref:J domain-containing protein n=1 Tax=Cladophialophora immunda TaxID=569365 RepID=A0A0D2BTK8_9EURO|nr:uncharacterized protein PV07_12812 [Cladophialophora immunda]KIW21760.1 hypothetical protein PV07_12812 [Cladophialophora immunda]
MKKACQASNLALVPRPVWELGLETTAWTHSAEQLRARLRQTITYPEWLEGKVAGIALKMSGNTAPVADPKGYFQVLGLDPRTVPEGFELLLTACYRTLARTRHPDKTGGETTEEFKKLQEAYEKLSDKTFREQYLAGGLK